MHRFRNGFVFGGDDLWLLGPARSSRLAVIIFSYLFQSHIDKNDASLDSEQNKLLIIHVIEAFPLLSLPVFFIISFLPSSTAPTAEW